jgi:hypothetical protein
VRSLIFVLAVSSLSLAGPTIRGQRDLTQAFRAALGDATNVAVVVDATPYVRAQIVEIGIALQELGRPGRWRLAVLGGRIGPATQASGALTPQLRLALAETRRHKNTSAALRKTLGPIRDAEAVVFLADWHFEDDDRPESLVKLLKGRKLRFSVIGSEAAFTRGWLDGYTWFGEEDQIDRIGKNPWRAEKGKIPWHGGETAYPHLPHRFGGMGWETEFARPPSVSPVDAKLPEDLRERLFEMQQAQRGLRRHPLPSAFGPYALSRICDQTGGRYVLWSWNRGGRAQVTYDYSRCELFAPDLRSRATIRKQVAKLPLARALNRAWHMVTDRKADSVRMTPSLGEDCATPQAMRPVKRVVQLSTSWLDRGAHTQFLQRAESNLKILDRARKVLAKPIRNAQGNDDPVARRYLADAQLFEFILHKQRFELADALAVAKTVRDDAWKNDQLPGLRRKALQGASHTILARRKKLLDRYRGTPFGEQIRRNKIRAHELTSREKPKGSPEGGNVGAVPAFSERERERPATPPAGGTSGGSAPSSG